MSKTYHSNRWSKVPALVGIIALCLIQCQPKDDPLPGIARIRLVVSHGKQLLPIYFIEDSTHNHLTLDLFYFDANNSFVTRVASPQFLVNGKPMVGNTYTFTQSGQYTFTAQVGNRTSENQLVVSAGSAADNISRFVIKTAVPFLNADSVSRLPLTYEIIDKQGHNLDLLEYAPVSLSINGVLRENPAFLIAERAAEYNLQASFLGRRSEGLSITARKPITYELVRLPVVIHILKSADPNRFDPATILAEVNKIYRKNRRSTDPNQADSYIEFVPAATDPDGHSLVVAGLDPLTADDPKSLEATTSLVNSLVHRWCPQKYINVFVRLDWTGLYGPEYSYAYKPNGPANKTISCDVIQKVTWQPTDIPAIYLYDRFPLSSPVYETLAHELGHFLGLAHTFVPTCSFSSQVADIPHHVEFNADEQGLKYTCDKTPFVSEYVMDYYTPKNSFTFEQVRYMRAVIQGGSYTPNVNGYNGGRQKAVVVSRLETGVLIPCKGQLIP